jgi:oligosaccharyltransferase complex subunit gamma
MHFLKALTVSLLPFTALAVKKPAADKFQQFHTKALASTPLKLDDSVYAKLTTAPRDYSVAVLLTALESRFGCQLCREFQPEWDLLSKSWTKGDKQGESRLVYGTLDFLDGKITFQSVRVELCPEYIASQLISCSLVFKPHQSSYSSNQQSVHMPQQTAGLSDMTLQTGTFIWGLYFPDYY